VWFVSRGRLARDLGYNHAVSSVVSFEEGAVHERSASLAKRALADVFMLLAFLAVFGAIFYRHRLPEWFRSLRAERWRIAQGSVETGDVTTMRAAVDGNFRFLRAHELARASLGYSHQVDATFYSGHYSKAFMDEPTAWNFVHAWKGQVVMVRCHPSKPDVSVMRLSERSCSPEIALLR
jgi:hypothetical protein